MRISWRALVIFAVVGVLLPRPGSAARIGAFCSVTDKNQLPNGNEQVSLRPAPVRSDGTEYTCATTTRKMGPGLETVREIWSQAVLCSDDFSSLGINPLQARQPLLADPLDNWSFIDPAWSPDGQYLAYARTDALGAFTSLWIQKYAPSLAQVGDPILVLDGEREGYHAIWGSSAQDVFVVGDRGRILHYDGTSWQRMTNEVSANLFAIWGSSGSDVYAVGGQNTVLHFDGTAWTPLTNVSSGQYAGVFGFNANDVYLFKAGSNPMVAGGTLYHFSGGSWAVIDPLTQDHYSISSIWGTSGNDLMGVGWGFSCPPDAGAIIQYGGAKRCPILGKANCYDNSACENIPQCQSVATPPSGCPALQGTGPTTLATWGAAANDRFAVGPGGNILHFDGILWSPMSSNTSDDLLAVWGTSGYDVYAAGTNGTIVHYNGSAWSPMTSNTTANILGIWGTSSSNVYAACDGGGPNRTLILHYDGNAWSRMVTNTRILSANRHPAWDPTGHMLAFDSDRSGTSLDLWAVPVLPVVGAPAQLTTNAGKAEVTPAWSPDGTEIAYASNNLGPLTIEIVPYPAGTPVRPAESATTLQLVTHANPSWSRDGESIYYDAPRCEDLNNLPDIWRIHLASQEKMDLTLSLAAEYDVDVSRVAPVSSGDYIAFTSLAPDPNNPTVPLGVNIWKGACVDKGGEASGQPGPNYSISKGQDLTIFLALPAPFTSADFETTPPCTGTYGLTCATCTQVVPAAAASVFGSKVHLDFSPWDLQALLGGSITPDYKSFTLTLISPIKGNCPLRTDFVVNIKQ